MAAAVSVAWGYAVVRTGSVVPAMVSHYCLNVLIELVLTPGMSEMAGAAVFGSLTIAYPLLTIGAVWLLGRLRVGTTKPESPLTPDARHADARLQDASR